MYEKIIAIGDIHAARDILIDIIERLGLVDKNLDWNARNILFVQIGDLCDRGPDSAGIYRLMMNWQRQAADYGSKVVFILGNHEIMAMYGYNHYTSSEEYAGYALEPGGSGQEERKAAFLPGGWVYKWLKDQRFIYRYDSLIFAHGDLPPSMRNRDIAAIESELHDEISGDRLLNNVNIHAMPDSLFSESDSIVWCRKGQYQKEAGYTQSLAAFLSKNNASAYICGHTPSEEGVFRLLHGGKFLCIDTAMVFSYRGIGSRSALVIEDNEAWGWYFEKDGIEKQQIDLKMNVK
jgi:hypothetical protein